MSVGPDSPVVGKHELPENLREVMRDNGVDPRAAYVESAEGWRTGDPDVDLSSDEESQKTLALVKETIDWVEKELESDTQGDAAKLLVGDENTDWD